MNGDVDIVIGKVERILAVPAPAVLEENSKAFFFLVKKNKVLKKERSRTKRSF